MKGLINMMNLRYNKKLKKYQLEGSENFNHVIYNLDIEDEESFLADVEKGILDLNKVDYEKIYFDEDDENERVEKGIKIFYEIDEDDCIDIDVDEDDLDVAELKGIFLQEFDYCEEGENLYFYQPHFKRYIEKILKKIYERTNKQISFNRWRVLHGDVL